MPHTARPSATATQITDCDHRVSDAVRMTDFLLQRIADDEMSARRLYEHTLADCDARRRVAELAKAVESDGLSAEAWAVAMEAARSLAAVYADHPDHDSAWQDA